MRPITCKISATLTLVPALRYCSEGGLGVEFKNSLGRLSKYILYQEISIKRAKIRYDEGVFLGFYRDTEFYIWLSICANSTQFQVGETRLSHGMGVICNIGVQLLYSRDVANAS